jgi:hypothetical protein
MYCFLCFHLSVGPPVTLLLEPKASGQGLELKDMMTYGDAFIFYEYQVTVKPLITFLSKCRQSLKSLKHKNSADLNFTGGAIKFKYGMR